MFGLNYTGTSSQLYGCHNDVRNVGTFLKGIGFEVKVFTDDVNPKETTGMGMIRNLYELGLRSHTQDLKFVWIHYSGHGSWVRDTNREELDGRDECLVPSDFQTNGFIVDDMINPLLKNFNPKTRVILVFDCCHSGTMCDLKYSWPMDFKKPIVENKNSLIPSNVLSLSGCLDAQTAADAFNVLGDNKPIGALTGCLLLLLQKDAKKYLNDIICLVRDLQSLLKTSNYSQVPKLCSTYNVLADKVVFPL